MFHGVKPWRSGVAAGFFDTFTILSFISNHLFDLRIKYNKYYNFFYYTTLTTNYYTIYYTYESISTKHIF